MNLRLYAVIAFVAAVVGVAENALFGADKGGLRHHVSVAFFLLTVVAVVALIGIGAVSLTRRLRRSRPVTR